MRQIICDDKGCRLEPSHQNLVGGGRVNTLKGGGGGLAPVAASTLLPITNTLSRSRRAVKKKLTGGRKKQLKGGGKNKLSGGGKKKLSGGGKRKLSGGSKKRKSNKKATRKRNCVKKK